MLLCGGLILKQLLGDRDCGSAKMKGCVNSLLCLSGTTSFVRAVMISKAVYFIWTRGDGPGTSGPVPVSSLCISHNTKQTQYLLEIIIYRFGGLSQGIAEATPKLNMLDLPMRSVTVKRSSGERLIPKRLSAAAYVESEGDIVVFAGDISHNEYAPTDRLVGYSLSANTWRVLASKGTPPRNRAYHQCCTYGRNRIFFFGGISESRQFVEGIHELFHTRDTWRWTHIPFSFPSRYRHSICCVGHKLFIFGGVKQSYTSPTNDLLVYDIINQESIEVQRKEVTYQRAGIYRTGALMATADHAVVASTDMIFVLGGVSRNINEVYTLRLNL